MFRYKRNGYALHATSIINDKSFESSEIWREGVEVAHDLVLERLLELGRSSQTSREVNDQRQEQETVVVLEVNTVAGVARRPAHQTLGLAYQKLDVPLSSCGKGNTYVIHF